MLSLLISILFGSSAFGAEISSLRYCVPVKTVDLNPYREISDGKELAFLTLLRSYISTESEEPGLLSGYEFSPDGKIFTGRLSPGLKWRDGSEVTPLEMAEGIAKTLPFRPIGKRIKATNLEIIDKSTFRITLSSEIENITGVFREALSTNSRHNRFWPIKPSGKKDLMVLAKFPQGEGASLIIGNSTVKLAAEGECLRSDFSIFPEALGPDLKAYSTDKSPSQSSIFLQLDTKKMPVPQRTALVSLIRHYFAKAPNSTGVVAVDGFFLQGEPGYKANLNWPTKESFSGFPDREIVIGLEHPLYFTLLSHTPAVKSNKIRLVTLPSNLPLDAHILASGMQGGRHVILQDILKWPWIEKFLDGAPETLANLKIISARSASTLPPDNQILSRFEEAAKKEFAMAPIARRHPVAYSRSGLSLRLSFNRKGEITFKSGPP